MTTENAIDWVSAQTMLLTDRSLRDSFRAAPDRVTRQLKIRSEEIPLFARLDPDQLDAQADTLVRKRFHEVGKLIPITFRALGENAFQIFSAYAATDWPGGHQRHLLDASRFGRHLKQIRTKGLHLPEQHWVDFRLRPGIARFFPVIFQHRSGKRYLAVQILTSIGGQTKQRFIYLAIPVPFRRKSTGKPVPPPPRKVR